MNVIIPIPLCSSPTPVALHSQPPPITDHTLRLKSIELTKATHNLQYITRVTIADPDVLHLADPSATTLKMGRNGVPVRSDEDALASYLVPVSSSGGVSPFFISLRTYEGMCANAVEVAKVAP